MALINLRLKLCIFVYYSIDKVICKSLFSLLYLCFHILRFLSSFFPFHLFRLFFHCFLFPSMFWFYCMPELSNVFYLSCILDRLVKIVDFSEGTFQDFIAHCDSVRVVKFSPNAKVLFSAGFTDIVVWNLSI